MRIEKWQAELQLAEVRAKRVECDTLTNSQPQTGLERTTASPIGGASVDGTTGKTPSIKEKHPEPPGDKTAATVEMTASPTKLPPADSGTPVRGSKIRSKER